eukprot:NODE_369_length_2340_cov_51.074559_g344_i0.p1 GENE.NODE_369_length_2340_cov_51.074559_g344_i0~~NODE_369_length_2340_cov_51.074559_g344_i0.p1  ORF type:complete len:659 (+),score=169.86 NODE_369_length_2340_cov_51.074559_g344_i0:11-1987(+)
MRRSFKRPEPVEAYIPSVTVSPEQLFRFIRLMKKGIKTKKHGKARKPSDKTLCLDADEQRLYYHPSKKHVRDVTFELHQLHAIVSGENIVNPPKTLRADREQSALQLVFKHERMLILEFNAAYDVTMWSQSLAFLVRKNRTSAPLDQEDPRNIHILQLWMETDTDNSRTLSYEEIMCLLDKLNLHCQKRIVKHKLDVYDTNNSGELDYTEFIHFYKDLMDRPEIKKALHGYYDHSENLNAENLTRFMHHVQKQSEWTLRDSIKLIRLLYKGRKGFITASIFADFLSGSPLNSWANPEHAAVTHDMTQPLTAYFIATSHNTFLTRDQLQSESSVEHYATVLKMGARCVELECWDGLDGNPIVTRGQTRCTRLNAQEVLQCINQHAFSTNPYPVIVMLELHMSHRQQSILATHIKTIFGRRLITKLGDIPFTPEAMKFRILLKSRQPSEAPDYSDDEKDCMGMPVEVIEALQQHTGQPGVSMEMGACVCLKAAHLESVPDPCSPKPDSVHSISETQCQTIWVTSPTELGEMNKRTFTRVYPAGWRYNSENQHLYDSWSLGCQFVSMNYQTLDLNMLQHQAKFAQNGSCGYLLKPIFLRSVETPYEDWGKTVCLHVRVVSGFQIPTPPRATAKLDIIDPWTGCPRIVCRARCDRPPSKQRS